MSALFKQAVTYFQSGNLGRAQELVHAVLTQEPLNADAWHLQGVLALNAKQYGEAAEHLKRAATLRPDDCAIHVNYAAALSSASQFQEALQVLTRALSLNPLFAEAHYQVGACRLGLGQAPEAATAFTEAVRLRPDWPAALEMLAHALQHTGEHEKSVQLALRALELEPNRATCHRVVGDGYMRWLRYDEALEHYRLAVRLAPDDGLIRNNLGLLFTRMGRNEEALTEYYKATALTPKSPQAREGYAFALLATGRLAEGWPNYVARQRLEDAGFVVRKGPPPATDPSQLNGKPVLAWLDQGIGDQIMFASLIPDLIAAGANLTVECDARLVPILTRSFPGIAARFPVESSQLPAASPPELGNEQFAYQIYMPDTARWFRSDFAAFPRHPGYLMADRSLTQKLRRLYLDKGGDLPLIGISWRTAINAKISVSKTLELEDWGPLLSCQNATFVSLQYGPVHREIADVSKKLGTQIVCDASVDPVKDIDTFASQVAAMDLVITTSNATAHMAGSLNVPVWTLVPKGFGAMWHWFLDREDSPWYPSMRLLRQVDRGDWRPVLNRAASMLADFIARSYQ
ncbi:MAG: tetratricopeptide repeat protein [Rhodospirillaceae bacterium]|nr:MAG: tetratricopeptide repeat protein [Rhodospirillaceae bacterium]